MSNNMIYDMKSFKFGRGKHETREDGMCLMEAVSYISGERHSDHPSCSDLNVTTIAIFLNDTILDDNKRISLLEPFLWRIPGTATPDREIFTARSNKITNLKKIMVEKYGFDTPLSSPIWENEVIPEYIKLLDELISMTEIKEIVPEHKFSEVS